MPERQPVVPRAHNRLDANRHRHVEGVPYGNTVKAWRRYADNLKRISVQCEPLADNSRIATKIALPEGKADVRSTYPAARLVIGWASQAPQERFNAEHMKKRTADAQ